MQNSNEPDKVLILGCSFTQGSYAIDPSDVKKEIIESTFGWYDKLTVFQGKQIDVYGAGGCGSTIYASILNQMEKNNTLGQYSIVVIQETAEPRLSLIQENHKWNITVPDHNTQNRTLDITHYSTFANYPHVVFSAHYYALDRILAHYNLNKTTEKYKLDLLQSPTLIDLVDQAKSHIKFLLEKHNIKSYVFSLFGEHLTDSYFYRLPLDSRLYDTIKNYSVDSLSVPNANVQYSFKHFSRYGNEVLGKLVNTSLQQF